MSLQSVTALPRCAQGWQGSTDPVTVSASNLTRRELLQSLGCTLVGGSPVTLVGDNCVPFLPAPSQGRATAPLVVGTAGAGQQTTLCPALPWFLLSQLLLQKYSAHVDSCKGEESSRGVGLSRMPG